MNLKHFKLAVFDLDGTLVEYGSEQVTPATLETIKMLRDNGIRVVIATGRSWKQTKAIADQLKVQTPVIVQSGAIVLHPVTTRILKITPLRPEIDQKLPRLIKNLGVDQFCLMETGVYFTDKVNTSGGKWLFDNGEDCRIGIPDLAIHKVVKRLLIGSEVELRSLSKRVGELKPAPNTILWPPDQLSDDWFLEVFDPLASKGQALTWLAAYLEVDCEQIIAFGDGYNDLDLLQTAGYGVAMQGSPPELIDQADLVIPGAAEEGIARLFRGEPVGIKKRVS
ncbi:MAG: Cof-type HAD-IIB family hydrolase [Firmicutes bacterium]|nr:Cof-type HAD-IIB family hydrolase [Bacillota bacterium]